MPLNNVANHILALPRPLKRFVVLAVDVGLCVLSVWVAFYLRLDEWVAWRTAVLWPAVVSVVFALPVFVVAGMYRAIFRYSGLPAMMAVARAMLLYGLGFASVFTLYGVDGVPRTVGVIQPVLLLLFVGGHVRWPGYGWVVYTSRAGAQRHCHRCLFMARAVPDGNLLRPWPAAMPCAWSDFWTTTTGCMATCSMACLFITRLI